MDISSLKKRREKLLKAIENTKNKKKKIIEIINSLIKEFNSGRTSKFEYEEKLNKALGKRSIEQWTKYYDDYLDYYKYQLKLADTLIKKEKGKESGSKRVFVLKSLIGLVLIGIIVSLMFSMGPVVFEKGLDAGKKAIIEFGKETPTPPTKETPPIKKELEDIELLTIQYPAVAGENVRFKTKISGKLDKLILPDDAKVSKVYILENGIQKEIDFKEDKKGIFNKRTEVSITGKAVYENLTNQPTQKNINNTKQDNEGEQIDEQVGRSKNTPNQSSLSINNINNNYEIIYEIPGPEIIEEKIKEKGVEKRIIIRGREDLHFENILAFSDISERFTKEEKNKIKIYRIYENKKESVSFNAYDNNENGLIDRLEWIVPYLSDAVYEIIIEISKAEHLDSDKDFISDIYKQVKEKDNTWSEEIYHNEYIRVTFERELDNSNDITIYARGDNNTIIEVYKSNKIAEFPIIEEEDYYKIYLNELEETEDTFDLRVVNLDNDENAYVKIDYIVDPTVCAGSYTWYRPVSTNNICSDSQSECYQASDGDSATKWDEQCVSPPYWIYFDLGSKKCISGIETSFGSYWGYDWNQVMDIEVSDNAVSWIKVYSNWEVTDPTLSPFYLYFTETQARYVRVYITDCNFVQAQVSEFRARTRTICTTQTCSQLGKQCGSWDDGCGGTLDCGTCSGATPYCSPTGQCIECLNAGHCDDSNECTDDACENSVCTNSNLPPETPCTGGVCDSDGNCIKSISNCQDLQDINNNLAGDYILISDIDCSEISNFNPIGDNINKFTGTFNGNKHTISNLHINRPGEDYIGLFGYTDNNAEIKKVGVKSANVIGRDFVGGLVGYNKATVEQNYIEGDVSNQIGWLFAGGLVGYNEGTIKDSYSKADVTGSIYVGGLVGYENGGIVENCYAAGSVSGGSSNGGLLGYHRFGNIRNSYSTGGSKSAGTDESSSGGNALLNCHHNSDETVFYTSSHAVYNGNPVWDFTNIWLEKTSDLPVLKWEPIDTSTIVSNCMILDQANTIYTMTDNIIDNTLTDPCININTENITLDCAGYYISSDNDYSGVYSNQVNTTIKNCNINMGSSGIGIEFDGKADNSTIVNNILNNQHRGLSLTNINNSLIKDNILNKNTYSGVYFLESSNNILINNTAINNSYYGFFLHASLNNNLTNLYAHNNSYVGVFLNKGSNNSQLINITSTNHSLHGGINIRESFNNTLENISSQNNLYGIIIYLKSEDNIIKNSNVSLNKDTDVNIRQTSKNNIFLNCSYDLDKEYVQSGSELIRKWHYKAYVEDESGIPVNEVNVTAFDKNNAYQFNLTTDSSGYTQLGSIVDYVNRGVRDYYNNHTISAVKAELYDEHSFNGSLGNNLKDDFILKAITPPPPEIVFISDIESYLNSADVPSADRDLIVDDLAAKRFEFYVWAEDLNILPVSGFTNNIKISLIDKDLAIIRSSNSEDCLYLREGVAPSGSVAHEGKSVKVYSCKVAMQYYDNYGSEANKNWEVRAMIKDNSGREDSNNIINNVPQPLRETYFNKLESFKLTPSPASLNFGEVSYGSDLNIEPFSSDYPIKVWNIGNADIDKTEIKACNINGTIVVEEYIPPEWFSAGDYGVVGTVCGMYGVNLVDEVYVDSGLSDILHGSSSYRELGICLNQMLTSHSGGSVSQQRYSTSGRYPWEIDVTYLLVAVVVAGRKPTHPHKKKKKKKINITDNNLLDVFEEKLKSKYGFVLKDVLNIVEEEKVGKETIETKEIKVPLDIFKEERGGAEVLTRYLKDVAGLKFSEIAELIKRDPRTVAINYKNAVEKNRKINYDKSSLLIPIEIFADRRLSILESVVGYLRKKGYKNINIAEMLGRDQRNIATLCFRTKRKL